MDIWSFIQHWMHNTLKRPDGLIHFYKNNRIYKPTGIGFYYIVFTSNSALRPVLTCQPVKHPRADITFQSLKAVEKSWGATVTSHWRHPARVHRYFLNCKWELVSTIKAFCFNPPPPCLFLCLLIRITPDLSEELQDPLPVSTGWLYQNLMTLWLSRLQLIGSVRYVDLYC